MSTRTDSMVRGVLFKGAGGFKRESHLDLNEILLSCVRTDAQKLVLVLLLPGSAFLYHG